MYNAHSYHIISFISLINPSVYSHSIYALSFHCYVCSFFLTRASRTSFQSLPPVHLYIFVINQSIRRSPTPHQRQSWGPVKPLWPSSVPLLKRMTKEDCCQFLLVDKISAMRNKTPEVTERPRQVINFMLCGDASQMSRRRLQISATYEQAHLPQIYVGETNKLAPE